MQVTNNLSQTHIYNRGSYFGIFECAEGIACPPDC